jgi:hypothetical protein
LQVFPVDLVVVAGAAELETDVEAWVDDVDETAVVGAALEEEATIADDEVDDTALAEVDVEEVVSVVLLLKAKVGWALGTSVELTTAAKVLVGTTRLSATTVGREGAIPANKSVWAPCMKPYFSFYIGTN